jgi:flavin reductase
MARLGAAVNIVTTDGPGGLAGFAATAVCSVSDSPPTLLVCLNRASSAYPAIKANHKLCVNVLGGHHEQLSCLFGGRTPVEERFAAANWRPSASGSPMLESALVSFDCEITSVANGHTHDVLLCEVLSLHWTTDGKALVYFDRGYHTI